MAEEFNYMHVYNEKDGKDDCDDHYYGPQIFNDNPQKDLTQFGHPKFYELLDKIKLTHSQKNHDYTAGREPLENFNRVEKYGIPAFLGAMVRMEDKEGRKEALVFRSPEVKGESLKDTFEDDSVYNLLTIILYDEFATCPDKDKILDNLKENAELLKKWKKERNKNNE